jgi:hypothetical protein
MPRKIDDAASALAAGAAARGRLSESVEFDARRPSRGNTVPHCLNDRLVVTAVERFS